METLRARVEGGRLVLDEPTRLPVGTVLELCVADVEDELDPKERAVLKEALRESWAFARAGRMRPVEKLLEELRGRGPALGRVGEAASPPRGQLHRKALS